MGKTQNGNGESCRRSVFLAATFFHPYSNIHNQGQIHSPHLLTDLEKSCICCPQLCWRLEYRSETIYLSQGFPYFFLMQSQASWESNDSTCVFLMLFVFFLSQEQAITTAIAWWYKLCNPEINIVNKIVYSIGLTWRTLHSDLSNNSG